MRSIETWFDAYAANHRHPTNVRIHWICVPAIVWSVVALLWTLPVPPSIGKPGLFAAAAMFIAFVFYQRLARRIGYAMLVVFLVMALASAGLDALLGRRATAAIATGVFVAAWIGQLIGHRIEGRRPSFTTDLAFLLIGPAWLVAKILTRFDIPYQNGRP